MMRSWNFLRTSRQGHELRDHPRERWARSAVDRDTGWSGRTTALVLHRKVFWGPAVSLPTTICATLTKPWLGTLRSLRTPRFPLDGSMDLCFSVVRAKTRPAESWSLQIEAFGGPA